MFAFAAHNLPVADALLQRAIASGRAEYDAQQQFRDALYRCDWGQMFSSVQAFVVQQHTIQTTRDELLQLWPVTGWWRRAVDEMATGYLTPPQRELRIDGKAVDPKSPAAAYLAEWQARCNPDGVGCDAERKSILHNAAITWVQWDAESALPTYTTVHPGRTTIDADPRAPRSVQRMRGVAIEVEAADMLPGRTTIIPRTWHVYRRGADGLVAHTVEDQWGKVLDANFPPLTRFPFVRLDEWNTTDWYTEGGDDLPREALQAGIRGARNDRNAKWSAHPQLVATGMRGDEVGGVQVGPGQVVAVPDPAGRIEYIEPTRTPKDLHDYSLARLQEWGAARGLPPQLFSISPTVESGEARFQARVPQYEQRALRTPKFVRWEADLWRATVAVREAHIGFNGGDYAPDVDPILVQPMPELARTTLLARFPDPRPALLPREELDLWERRTTLGLEDPAQRVADERGIPLDDARAQLAANKRAAAAVAPRGAADDLLAQSFGGTP